MGDTNKSAPFKKQTKTHTYKLNKNRNAPDTIKVNKLLTSLYFFVDIIQ